MRYLNLVLLLSMLLFVACQDKQKEDIKQLVSEWQGKEVLFPQDLVFTRFVSDTVNFRIPESSYKVLVYVDSIGCTSCKLQLHRWKELIQYTDSVTQGAVPFLFFFQSNDKKEIRYILKRDNFDKPICLDLSDRLNQLNRFPSDSRFHTFLLDKDNKVVVIGNPIHNPNVRALYLKEITGKQSASSIQTTVEVDATSIQLETIRLGESREAVFQLTNTGNNLLVILDAATTCGCAHPSFDKHPARPGETLRVKVVMTPKDDGYFDEIITVKCNTDQLIKLNIRGMAQ